MEIRHHGALFPVPPLAAFPSASLSRPAVLALASAAGVQRGLACSGMGGMGAAVCGNTAHGAAGGALTDPQGLTLYTFEDRDDGGWQE
ncbi:hypothetical protein ACU4GD_36240 [Cupriavidus basilensis]